MISSNILFRYKFQFPLNQRKNNPISIHQTEVINCKSVINSIICTNDVKQMNEHDFFLKKIIINEHDLYI